MSSHPRNRLDDVIHSRVRLSIMAALAGVDRIDFGYLRELVQVSDSLLSKHMTTLKNAGYIEVIKGYHGRRPVPGIPFPTGAAPLTPGYIVVLNEIVGKPR